jgi:GNAT superfamily N-acetyltransferase
MSATDLPPGVEISTDKARLDLALIHDFLAHQSYWVPGITRATVESCIRAAFCFGLYVDGRQAGFARVVTDYVRIAYLSDVFITPAFRGRELGKRLVRAILEHPRLQAVGRFTLSTDDAHGLYAQFGFAAPEHPERQMELLRPAPPPVLG